MKIGPNLSLLALVASFSCASWSAELSFPSTPPTEPKDAAKTMHVLDGFEMQLIAAEPLVTDPVALTYDEDGRAYVCEMNDYPYTDKEHHKHSQVNPTDMPIGKVRLLVDTNGDGVFDKATIFADGLSWPTGSACWKGGIFVVATPDIWYLKDTDGDGVADVRQKVFTGFTKLNVQAVMNNPIWGLDHRIYVAGGSNGGTIERVPGSESVMPLPKDFKPIAFKRNDFSFDPSTGDVRLESGGARFGNTFDDWGNRFLCNIRNPCQHVVLPYRYLARNPYLVVPSALNDCAEAGDQLPVWRTSLPEPWREFRAKRWVSEGSTLPKSELVGAGVVTSSSGICVYRGDAYPKEYRDFAFVADVAGNLFYRLKLTPDGVTFKATQVDGNKNFCTSDDLWFRPVNFVNAPDGCLHVCDMYREVIEHPWSIPDDIHEALDLLRGRDRGRIWRLAPKVVMSFSSSQPTNTIDPSEGGAASARSSGLKPRTTFLSRATTTELVALLDHPNAWHRETAQRLLFERQDKAAVEPLRAMVKDGKTTQGRIGAICSLQSIVVEKRGAAMKAYDDTKKLLASGCDPAHRPGALTGDDLARAIEDKDPRAVANALRLAEEAMPRVFQGEQLPPDFGEASQSEQLDFVVRLIISANSKHSDVRIAFSQALAMSGSYEAGDNPKLGEIAYEYSNDAWIRLAILCASLRSPVTPLIMIGGMLPDQERRRMPWKTGFDILLPELTRVYAQSTSDRLCLETLLMPYLMETDQKPRVAESVLLACVDGLRKRNESIGDLIRRGEKLRDVGRDMRLPSLDELSGAIDRILQRQLLIANSTSESVERRAGSVRLLSSKPFSESGQLLRTFIAPGQHPDLQLAALEALGSYREPAVADILIDAWPKLTPPLREKAVALMLSHTDRIAKLLDAIEAKKILPGQLSAASRATLQRQKNEPLASRIAKLFEAGNSNRAAVITKYQDALKLAGDSKRGEKVYETTCMVCHKHGDKGNDIGPHLGTIKAWTPEQILTNVLDPNREVSPNFALYIIETNDGRTLSGLIASETAGNLVLRLADGSQQSLLRSDIKSLSSPGISLMPEGLEAAITPQQMADLIEFLRK